VRLSDYTGIVAYDIGFWLTALRNPDYPVADLGEVCLDAQAKLRTVAIIQLLSHGDVDRFAHRGGGSPLFRHCVRTMPADAAAPGLVCGSGRHACR
jgi:hypothetical protein